MSPKKNEISKGNNLPLTKKDVPAAIESLQKTLAKLTKNVDDKVSTNVSYGHKKIKDIKTVKELLEISASIHSRADAFKDEVERYELSVKLKPFTTFEKTVEEWESIIKKAIFELVNATQINKTKEAIEKLSNHLDEESKLQKELAEIMESSTAEIE